MFYICINKQIEKIKTERLFLSSLLFSPLLSIPALFTYPICLALSHRHCSYLIPPPFPISLLLSPSLFYLSFLAYSWPYVNLFYILYLVEETNSKEKKSNINFRTILIFSNSHTYYK